jgi:hypothetical protein
VHKTPMTLSTGTIHPTANTPMTSSPWHSLTLRMAENWAWNSEEGGFKPGAKLGMTFKDTFMEYPFNCTYYTWWGGA